MVKVAKNYAEADNIAFGPDFAWFFYFGLLMFYEILDIVNLVFLSTQPVFTSTKLTIEILEQGVKYVQS